MNPILICLIVTSCIVYIWDYVSFPQEIANLTATKLTGGRVTSVELKKPLGCSLCMSTWITLAILLVLNWELSPLCLVYGMITKYILMLITLSDEIITKVLMLLEDLLNKIK